MTFEVSRDTEQPTIQNDGMKYEGLRFRAECRMAGKLYGQAFGVDVAFRDSIIGDPETVATDDVLAFAGITPPVVMLYPVETHIAEKLHAYRMPRARPNTRVKDLPDIASLATTGPLDATQGPYLGNISVKWICAGSSEKTSTGAWLSPFRPGGSLELSQRVRRCSLHGLPNRVNQ